MSRLDSALRRNALARSHCCDFLRHDHDVRDCAKQNTLEAEGHLLRFSASSTATQVRSSWRRLAMALAAILLSTAAILAAPFAGNQAWADDMTIVKPGESWKGASYAPIQLPNGLVISLSDDNYPIKGLVDETGTAGETYDFSYTSSDQQSDEQHVLTIYTNRPFVLSGGTADAPITGRISMVADVNAGGETQAVQITFDNLHLESLVAGEGTLKIADANSLSLTVEGVSSLTNKAGDTPAIILDSSGGANQTSVHVEGEGALTCTAVDASSISGASGSFIKVNSGALVANGGTDANGAQLPGIDGGAVVVQGGTVTASGIECETAAVAGGKLDADSIVAAASVTISGGDVSVGSISCVSVSITGGNVTISTLPSDATIGGEDAIKADVNLSSASLGDAASLECLGLAFLAKRDASGGVVQLDTNVPLVTVGTGATPALYLPKLAEEEKYLMMLRLGDASGNIQLVSAICDYKGTVSYQDQSGSAPFGIKDYDIDGSSKSFYACGSPVVIADDSLAQATQVSVPLTDSPIVFVPVLEGDLSQWAVYGGSSGVDDVGNDVSITMTSGEVGALYGGAPNSGVAGNVNISVGGGVRNLNVLTASVGSIGATAGGAVAGNAVIVLDEGANVGGVVAANGGAIQGDASLELGEGSCVSSVSAVGGASGEIGGGFFVGIGGGAAVPTALNGGKGAVAGFSNLASAVGGFAYDAGMAFDGAICYRNEGTKDESDDTWAVSGDATLACLRYISLSDSKLSTADYILLALDLVVSQGSSLTIDSSESLVLHSSDDALGASSGEGSIQLPAAAEEATANGKFVVIAHLKSLVVESGGGLALGTGSEIAGGGTLNAEDGAQLTVLTPRAEDALSVASQTYTGSAIKPAIQFGTRTIYGLEFAVAPARVEVTYKDNVRVGKATASVSAYAYDGDASPCATLDVPFSIQPAVLTAAYAGETVEWNGKPQLAVEVTGFVNGETAETASNYAVPAITMPDPLVAGKSYELTPSGGAADNYVFVYVTGVLTVGFVPNFTTTVTIPVSGEENTVHAEVTVSGDGAVEVAPLDAAEIEQVVGEDVQTGVVTIDLSGLEDDVTQVTLPVATLEAITKAAEAAHNDTESIEIVMPQGTVSIDDASMRAVLDQAQGSEVVLVLENTGTSKLNGDQKAALEGADVQGGYEAYFECPETGERIGDFQGGTATLSVPFDVPEGRKGSGYQVWYVSDEGEVQKMKTFHVGGKLMWHVPHMSDYVVVYEDHPAYEDCEGGGECPLSDYPDVKAGAWYHDGLHWAVESGILKGGDDGKMNPDGAIDRQTLMVMLHRYAAAAGMNTAVYEDTSIMGFGDSEDVSSWAMESVQWAVGSGVMKGYATGELGANDKLTREQTATFLHRFAGYLGVDVSEGEDTNILSFADAFEISEWAMEAMQWACGSGLVTGYTDASGAQTGELGPADGCTRAQAATMIMRFDAIA